MAARNGKSGKSQGTSVVKILESEYPDARLTLDFTTPFELLVATVLAAQCTDERVNLVTSSLFAKYRSPRDYLQVPPEELEEDIRSTGFYRNKARSLRGICSALLDEFDGAVPETVESLVTLPGVGRKTANIVLGNAFEKNAVAVDTHVGRVARRIGLASSDDPDVIEKELQDCIPRKKWTKVSHLLVFHGRRRCKSRKPLCGTCPLFDLCRFDERGKYATV